MEEQLEKTSVYKIIDHTADSAFEISGKSIEELLTSAAEAWKETAVQAGEIDLSETLQLNFQELSREELLVSFLNELNFQLLVKRWLYGRCLELHIHSVHEGWNMTAAIKGEKLNEKKHTLKSEIKAVTFHQLEIKKDDDTFSTKLVFDI